MFKQCASLALLLTILTGVSLAAPDQWIEVRTGHFTIYSNVGEKKTREIGDQFERLRWMFKTLFPKADVDPVEPLVVIAVKNRNQFRDYEPADYLAKGTLHVAGYFAGSTDRDYILLRTDTETEHPFAIVFHEYTHLQFRDDAEWMPLWLSEGIAEFFQNTEFRQKNVQLGEASVNDILFLRQNRLIPLTDLFHVDRTSPYYHEENKGNIFYAESWALTHYLMITGKISGKNLIGDYMNRMSRHEDPVQAAEESFGDLKKLQSDLDNYIRNSSYKQFVLNSAVAAIDDSKFVVRPLSQIEVDAARADELAHIGRSEEAAGAANAVLKADPKNAIAHETLAYIAYRKGDHASAMDQYAQAAQLHSTNFFAYFLAGLQKYVSGSADQKIAAEAELRESIRLNARFIPPYVNLANLLMSNGKFDDAQMVLAEAQIHAHTTRDLSALSTSQEQLQNMITMRSQSAVAPPPNPGASATVITMPAPETPPDMKHPEEPVTGPKHIAVGTIQSVRCGYPSVLELTIATRTRPVKLYINNYFKLQVSAVNFTPDGEMQPCKDLQGMKARVQYVQSSDKSVDGQIIDVELRK